MSKEITDALLGEAATLIEEKRDEISRLRCCLLRLVRMNYGLEWCDSKEQACRWAEARELCK